MLSWVKIPNNLWWLCLKPVSLIHSYHYRNLPIRIYPFFPPLPSQTSFKQIGLRLFLDVQCKRICNSHVTFSCFHQRKRWNCVVLKHSLWFHFSCKLQFPSLGLISGVNRARLTSEESLGFTDSGWVNRAP